MQPQTSSSLKQNTANTWLSPSIEGEEIKIHLSEPSEMVALEVTKLG